MTAAARPKHPKLHAEATDPETPGARLAYLARHRSAEVAAIARRNPNLAADDLRDRLGQVDADVWQNPAAALVALDGVTPAMQWGARMLVARGAAPPLARTVTGGWWANEPDPAAMLEHLAHQASWQQQTHVHRRAVSALCACLRWTAAHRALSAPRRVDWIKPDERLHPVVAQFETWAAGGERPSASFDLTFVRASKNNPSLFQTCDGGTLFSGALARAVLPRDEPRPVATRVEVAAAFYLAVVPALADLLRAVVPDPTEGL